MNVIYTCGCELAVTDPDQTETEDDEPATTHTGKCLDALDDKTAAAQIVAGDCDLLAVSGGLIWVSASKENQPSVYARWIALMNLVHRVHTHEFKDPRELSNPPLICACGTWEPNRQETPQ